MNNWWFCLLFIIGWGLLLFGPVAGKVIISKSAEYKRQFTVKSVLDGQTLGLLQQLNGLMIASNALDAGTIRFLFQHGILKNEVFPSSPVTYGYCLTSFGKGVLSDLGVKIFPEIVVEMHRIRYWEAYPDQFNKQKKQFKNKFKKDYDKCLESYFAHIPEKYISSIIKNGAISYKQKLDIFGKYLETSSISYEQKIEIFN